MILVVGATGQLGTAVCKRLATEGYPVRAFVRPGSAYKHLEALGVELVGGDLRNADSVRAAVAQVDAVVATANADVPGTAPLSFDEVEGDGYFNLVRACQRNPIDRLIFLSVPTTPYDDLVPTYRYKRVNEERIRRSGVPYTIVRCAPFMDDWIAMMGSSVPLRGSEAHRLRRPFWFPRMFMMLTGRLMDGLNLALVPGTGWTRHAFVAVDDVAGFVIASLFRGEAEDRTFNVGGPEILTWDEAVDACSRVLGTPIRKVHVPSVAYRLQQLALDRVSPHAANLSGTAWIKSQWDTLILPSEAKPVLDGRDLTTVEQFFRRKMALAPVHGLAWRVRTSARAIKPSLRLE